MFGKVPNSQSFYYKVVKYEYNSKSLFYMASINMLVSEIVHAVRQPNNKALRENVRNIIIHTRNELFRQSYTKNGYVDKVMNYRFKVSLKDILDGDIILPDGLDLTDDLDTIKRTTQKVPRPTRFNNNLPFMRLSTIGYKTNLSIPFVKETTARFAAAVPGMNALPYYDYINDYIYLFNLHGRFTNLQNIIIETPFENPSLVQELDGQAGEFNALYGDDNEWFVPEDMIGQIKDIVFKRELLDQVRQTNEVDAQQQVK